MKKLFLFAAIICSVFFIGATGWIGSQKPVKEWNDYFSYRFKAEFDTTDTFNSRDVQIKGRSRDVSWVTMPFHYDLQIDTLGSPTAVSATIYILGGFDSINIPCDTIAVTDIAKDSTLISTFDLNDKKFPNYLIRMIADSCTVDLQFY